MIDDISDENSNSDIGNFCDRSELLILQPKLKKARRSISQRPQVVKTRKLPNPNSYKEKVNHAIQRLTNVSIKFCTSGKMDLPPVVVISTKMNTKRIAFPLYENEFTDSLIKEFMQAPFGRGTKTVVDKTIRNSLQLNTKEFQICNKDWNSYLTKNIIPRIKDEMQLDLTFKASLHKLLLYQSGSFFKSHRDSEKEEGMFGTLVIQLPSRYEGGEFVVRHNGKMEQVDFSTKANPQNEFSVFYTAFYCDCEHEIMPVTNGFRVCLIYNLIATNRNKNEVPTVAKIDEHSDEMDKFKNLLKQWPDPQKLIYCLTHKYSEKNLSLDKLKTTDKLVAKFLKNIAEDCSLEIMMGTLEKEITGRVSYKHEALNSSDEEMCQKGYKITNLKSLHGKDVSIFDSLAVNFKKEVVQDDCFDNVKAFSSQENDTGNEGIEVEYSYRCAAIIMFRKEDILPVLKRGKKPRKIIEDMFFKLLDECNNKKTTTDQKTKDKLFNWAKEVAAIKCHYYGDVINPRVYEAIASFESVELFQIYLEHQELTNKLMPTLLEICEKFGWSKFSTQLCVMFSKVYNHDKALEYFEMLIDDKIDSKNADKLKAMHEIMKSFLSSAYDNKNRIISKWLLAKKIEFNITEFSKSKSVEVMVPVLIHLTETDAASVMDTTWIEVAQYFLTKMEEATEKKIALPTWRRIVTLRCSCSDCSMLSEFLKKENVSTMDFKKISPIRRNHMTQITQAIPNWYNSIWISYSLNTLTITKRNKENQVEYDKQQNVIRLLNKLRSFKPINVKQEFKFAVKSEIKSESSVKKDP